MPTWLLSLLGLVEQAPTLIASVETLVSGIANELGHGTGQTNPTAVGEALTSAVSEIHSALTAVPAEVNPAAEADGDKFRESEGITTEDTAPGSVA